MLWEWVIHVTIFILFNFTKNLSVFLPFIQNMVNNSHVASQVQLLQKYSTKKLHHFLLSCFISSYFAHFSQHLPYLYYWLPQPVLLVPPKHMQLRNVRVICTSLCPFIYTNRSTMCQNYVIQHGKFKQKRVWQFN